MDPSWNPAADMQAIDRAYRIGTKRDVNVYRFVSAGTIEEIMYSRQVYKQQQSNVAVENMQEPRYFDGEQTVHFSFVCAHGAFHVLAINEFLHHTLVHISFNVLICLEWSRSCRHLGGKEIDLVSC